MTTTARGHFDLGRSPLPMPYFSSFTHRLDCSRARTAAGRAAGALRRVRGVVRPDAQDNLPPTLSGRGLIVAAACRGCVQRAAMPKGSSEAKHQAEQDALRMRFIAHKE